MTNDQEWVKSVLSMAKHKLLEKLESLNKFEYHDSEETREYKDALKALYYLKQCEKD